jgi:hypothetical protein
MRDFDCASPPLNTTPRTLRLLLGVLLVSAVVLAASPARASDTPRIFPLVPTTPLAPELADAPAALTDALAALLDGVTTDRSLEDFGKKLRCNVEMTPCLDAVARALVTSRLVYGTVVPAADGKIKVKLVRFDSTKAGSELHQRTFTLTARTPKRLGKQLARSAAQMFELQPPTEEVVRGGKKRGEETGDEEPEVTLIEGPEPAASGERAGGERAGSERAGGERAGGERAGGERAGGGITNATWGLIGGGALGVAVGGGFLLAARSLEGDLQRAPRETVTDFQRIVQIERAGRIRATVGGTLMVAGGVALAVGAVRAYLQHGGGRKSESMERSLALVPVEGGGAALVLSGGLR